MKLCKNPFFVHYIILQNNNKNTNIYIYMQNTKYKTAFWYFINTFGGYFLYFLYYCIYFVFLFWGIFCTNYTKIQYKTNKHKNTKYKCTNKKKPRIYIYNTKYTNAPKYKNKYTKIQPFAKIQTNTNNRKLQNK